MSKNKRNKKSKKKENIKKNNYIGVFILSGIIVLFLALFGFQVLNEKSTNISGLPAGTPAPDFTLQSTKGEISLADFQGKKNVVIYFYEGNS